MTSSNLPYHAGYAKSSRGTCKKCDLHIEEGILRIADSQSSKFYHLDCFFETHQPTTVKEIEHFGELEQEDQDEIQKKIKSTALQSVSNEIGYAKSGRSTCHGCHSKIPQGEIRISHKKFDVHATRGHGPQDQWFHIECFKQHRQEFGLTESIEVASGFSDLKKEDQKMLLEQIPALPRTA